jgi:microcystin-dependent protein
MSSIYNTGKGSIYNESDEFMAGQVAHCASGVIPVGWMECNGAAISRTTYGTLFAAIGTNYGSGDGATTFNLPDLRGEFVRGADRGRGIDPGRVIGSYQEDLVKAHSHAQVVAEAFTEGDPISSGKNETEYATAGVRYPYPLKQATDQAGGRESRPRNVALIPIIKYS